MKEKIQLLSRGVFEYENPEIEVSEKEIALEVEAGSHYSGTIQLNSRNHIEIRAMIFSSNKWMQCLESTVIGTTGCIHYVFDTQALETGEVCEGCFYIVSNGGEITIPYRVKVCAPFCDSSMGPMNDLDQFASLARDNWSEALKIFKTPEFGRVFLHNKKNRRIYAALIKGSDMSLAMEEFLCTVKRKQAVQMSVSQDLIEFDNLEHPVSEHLLIEKNQWGHVNIHVSTEGDFLSVYKKTVTDEDFLGSYYQLEYNIVPGMHTVASGKIILETLNQRIVVPVCCRREKARDVDFIERKTLKASWMHLCRLYLKYALHQIDRNQMIGYAREDINGCLNNSRDILFKVVEADFLREEGKNEEAQKILDGINGRELRYRSAVAYSYFLYVNALCRQDEHYTEYVRDSIQFYEEGQYHDRWELVYMLMKLDAREEQHQLKILRQTKALYDRHLMGGLMYLEAVKIINKDPSLIREMGAFEISLFLWGIRHDCLNRETIFRFADLVLRMHVYHGQCLHAMIEMCSLYETKNLLSAVLHLLILGEKKDPIYHQWYQLGIKSSIKMQGLFEYYMATLDMKNCRELPVPVLIYFQYDNRLQLKQKAFLFRYVIEHEQWLGKLFEAYDGIIKAFTFEQLQKGVINEDIAVLYHHYLTKEAMTPHVVKAMPAIIFKHHIHCDHPGIVGVIIDYSELGEEKYYPLNQGDAYVDLYMDDYRIVLVDTRGGRYMSTIPYTIDRLMDAGRYIRICYEQGRDNKMLVLNRSERALKYQMMDDVSIETYKCVLSLPDVSRHYQKTILKNLIDYYYDNYEGETLEKYLLQLDIQLLGHSERSHIIEYFIQRGLFDKAYEAIREYGYEGIQDKRIMRLCSRVIREKNFAKDELLVELAYFAFSNGKYDETILQYLIMFYAGTTEQLYAIWKAAGDFEVPAEQLEERLLCEILFTENHVAEGCDVFVSYYHTHPGHRLIRAFLGYYGYHYLVHGQTSGEKIFQIMEIELDQVENARDVCALALLQYYSEADHVEPEFYEKLQQEVAAFMDKGILLPFFRKYAGNAEVPEELADFLYAEYHTSPKAAVTIHYRLHQEFETEWINEPMRHILGGIFIRTFRLFAGEEIEYYISEQDENGEKTGEKHLLQREEAMDAWPETGVELLNRMNHAIQTEDSQAVNEMICSYERINEMTEQLFELK
ncbi:MAG: DUF5717 family protein [Coprococcus catus]|nr:DUF5717 family protein [Coprococcus catus]